MSVFLDNCSTTKILPEVLDSIIDAVYHSYGNASSLHSFGYRSEKIIRNCHDKVLDFINAKNGKVYFTSGGTESNNLAIFGSFNIKCTKNIVTSTVEHASVYKPINYLKSQGADVKYIVPSKDFEVFESDIDSIIDSGTDFISVMYVNNETGMIFPIEEISNIRSRKCPNAILHVDAVQCFGKIPIDVDTLGIDFLSASSHKIHGPKGLGILYVSDRVKLKPIIMGGEQQGGIRPGTEPVELIQGLYTSLNICNIEERFNFVQKLNLYCRSKLENIDKIVINSPSVSSPYILNFSIIGLKSEVLLNFLSKRGVYVSSASACSRNKKSHVLSSVGLSEEIIDSAIRVSFSILNTKDDIDELIKSILDAKNELLG